MQHKHGTRALLLAAGMGTRLRPLTDTLPKCLVPVQGRPLLDYWLDLLFDAGIERVLINTHWLSDVVEAHVAASPWRSSIDLVYEPELLGTGGTILANRAYFGRDPFIGGHADNLTDLDVKGLLAAYAARPPECIMAMLAFRTDDPSSCGILELDDRNVVLAFHEKVANPPGNLANGAVYVIDPEVVDRIAACARPFVDLSVDIIPPLMGRIVAAEVSSYHRDIGNMVSLQRAQSAFMPRPRQAGSSPKG